MTHEILTTDGNIGRYLFCKTKRNGVKVYQKRIWILKLAVSYLNVEPSKEEIVLPDPIGIVRYYSNPSSHRWTLLRWKRKCLPAFWRFMDI